MRRFFLLAVFVFSPLLLPASTTQTITVEQLRQTLTSQLAAHVSDDELARHLGTFELSERLTPTALQTLITQSRPGPKTTEALALLADISGLLDAPADERLEQAPPDAPAQQKMVNAAVQSVAAMFRRLPNFLATRLTRSFDDAPLVVTHSGWAPSHTDLHLAGTFEQEITYRNGKEAALHSVTTSNVNTKQGASPPGLTSSGEFGPVLATVLRDTSKGTITWSHWEKTSTGIAAAFHYAVPESASHYRVDFCCVHGTTNGSGLAGQTSPDSDPDNAYRGTPGYHGSITIDPATGTIVRLTIDPELKQDGPIMRSAIAVDYGTVEIGGQSYTCPVRSIAISLAKTRLGGDMSDRSIFRINEVTFTNYHRFGSSSRILVGDLK